MSAVINVLQLGTIDYATALRLQKKLVEMRKAGAIADTLLLLEHTPVITLGRNSKPENLVASEKQLHSRGVELHECDRGGDVTYHGPGQLVGYPIFDLRNFTPKLGAVDYVRKLEEALIRVCADSHVATERVAGRTGVWTAAGKSDAQRKIASIGVHISRGVTSHGFALNVNTDLSYFQLIVPCGIEGCLVTSLEKELGKTVEMEEICHRVSRQFGQVFRQQMVWLESLDDLLPRPQDIPMQAPKELRRMRDEDSTWA